MENCYYVYLHRKLSDGEIFYVGKGKDRRAYSSKSRSSLWRAVKDKYGLVVEIYKDNLLEKEALQLEIQLIIQIGRRDLGTGTLVNFTDGGDTTNLSPIARKKISDKAKGRVFTDETRAIFSRAKLNKFRNNPYIVIGNESGRILEGLFSEILLLLGRDYYTSLRNLIAGRTKKSKGWMLNPSEDDFIKYYERYSTTPDVKFTFVSKTTYIEATKNEFTKKTGIRTSPILRKNNPTSSINGWAVLYENETIEECRERAFDKIKPIYEFYNKVTQETFIGTKKDFITTFSFTNTALGEIFRGLKSGKSSKYSGYKGWILIKEKYD